MRTVERRDESRLRAEPIAFHAIVFAGETMHVARETAQELLVVAGTRWLAAVCAGASLVAFVSAIARHNRISLGLGVFLLLCALVMNLRKTFTFDAMQRVVRWKGRTVLKAESGEIPFDDILDIGTEEKSASSGSGGNQVPIYRVAIVTSKATIPMAYTYNGQPDRYEGLRRQILEFIGRGRSRQVARGDLDGGGAGA